MTKEEKIQDLVDRVWHIRLENLTKDEIGNLANFFYGQYQSFEYMLQEIEEIEKELN